MSAHNPFARKFRTRSGQPINPFPIQGGIAGGPLGTGPIDIFNTGIGSGFVDIEQPVTQPPKQSLLDKILGNLGSPGTQFALRLLEQAGPQPFPTSFGQAIGRAGLDTFQGQQRNQLADALNRLRESQIQRNQSLAENPNPQAGNVAKTFKGANGNMWVITRGSTQPVDTGVPFNENVKFFTQSDGSVIGVDASSGERLGTIISPQDAAEATTRRNLTKQQSEVQGKAVTDLPKIEIKTQNNFDLLDKLENHPGLPGIIGLKNISSVFGVLDRPVGGSREAGALALVEQISGSVFLEAFQELKGGGHITEIEGEKAEQAIARIKNRDQDEKDYAQAITDLREIMQLGLDRQRRAAQGDFSIPIPDQIQNEIDAL